MGRAFILALRHKDDEPLPIYGNIKSQDNFHIFIARPTPVGSDNAVCKFRHVGHASTHERLR